MSGASDHPVRPPREIEVRAGRGLTLPGTCTVPHGAVGLVVFAHGSGSSRHSPRNIAVAEALHGRGLATLLFDLLTEREAADRRNVFDIGLLARRVGAAVRWAESDVELARLPLGLFGASTGAAAALVAAADLREEVAAVVSRGGRPDLAAARLGEVAAPTLLIVGGRDTTVLELNEQAHQRLRCPAHLAVVPGAGHLFEEPGTLEVVTGLAGDWFRHHLAPDVPDTTGGG